MRIRVTEWVDQKGFTGEKKRTIDTSLITDSEFYTYFPQTWDAVCRAIAEASGKDLGKLRREYAEADKLRAKAEKAEAEKVEAEEKKSGKAKPKTAKSRKRKV